MVNQNYPPISCDTSYSFFMGFNLYHHTRDFRHAEVSSLDFTNVFERYVVEIFFSLKITRIKGINIVVAIITKYLLGSIIVIA